ncbi:unnamed protein product [Onchocerca ochengi]|uniref:Prothymosin alpha-like n=1 Tax=Onchocerca ochengi TaxID=42157 RepID=A0A182EM72_ONCOC|nr:unnamed protein product [Onchocerca ochengi]
MGESKIERVIGGWMKQEDKGTTERVPRLHYASQSACPLYCSGNFNLKCCDDRFSSLHCEHGTGSILSISSTPPVPPSTWHEELSETRATYGSLCSYALPQQCNRYLEKPKNNNQKMSAVDERVAEKRKLEEKDTENGVAAKGAKVENGIVAAAGDAQIKDLRSDKNASLKENKEKTTNENHDGEHDEDGEEAADGEEGVEESSGGEDESLGDEEDGGSEDDEASIGSEETDGQGDGEGGDFGDDDDVEGEEGGESEE